MAQRFDWGREKSIYAMAVRVFRLPKPLLLPLSTIYAGCKSWVELEIKPDTAGSIPVLDDASFQQQLETFHLALDPVVNLPRLILASASPRRSELLSKMGFQFQVVPSDAEESHSPSLTAVELSQINAWRKARSVARRFPDHLVIGVDTLVTLDAKLYGKPRDRADAARMLFELQGKTHLVVSGVCLLHLDRQRQTVFAETTLVAFRPMTTGTIQTSRSRRLPVARRSSQRPGFFSPTNRKYRQHPP